MSQHSAENGHSISVRGTSRGPSLNVTPPRQAMSTTCDGWMAAISRPYLSVRLSGALSHRGRPSYFHRMPCTNTLKTCAVSSTPNNMALIHCLDRLPPRRGCGIASPRRGITKNSTIWLPSASASRSRTATVEFPVPAPIDLHRCGQSAHRLRGFPAKVPCGLSNDEGS